MGCIWKRRFKRVFEMNNYDLNGRLAVITGGAQGIGFAVAQRFIASGAGVMIWDQDDAQGQAAVA